MMRHRRQRGFSLIELMLVVAMISILASLLIPHLLTALQRAKQRRTMGELAMVGQAWMSWLTDQSGASSAGQQKVYDITGFLDVTYPELFGYLHPTQTFFYMQEVPQHDAWGSEMFYWRNSNLLADRALVICASARDTNAETCQSGSTFPIGSFASTDFDSDIIWADGGLIRWPLTTGSGNN